MSSTQKLIRQANTLCNRLNREVVRRSNFFFKKSETWQESVTGDKYSTKTEMIGEMARAIDEQLANFPAVNFKESQRRWPLK